MKLTKIDCNIYLHDNYHDLFFGNFNVKGKQILWFYWFFFFRLNGNCITAMK